MERLHLARLESWALATVSLAQSRARVEDARVELKREWPTPEKAARRLAAHANAALGSEILWLIGIDDGGDVPGAAADELADWWSQNKPKQASMAFPQRSPI